MIFGFNTDVKINDTVYHVQSEARENDLLLQTQIFIKGRCLGKRATSYAGHIIKPEFNQETMHELLKVQHKLLLEIVRAGGEFEALFNKDGDIPDAQGSGLAMRWTNSDLQFDGMNATIKLFVHDLEEPADGALLTTRLFTGGVVSAESPIHSQSMTEEDGTGDIEVDFSGIDQDEKAIWVMARYGEKSVTRKLRLKKTA